MDVSLDQQTFKALASSTRIDVLKLLGKRRYMQSEIADILKLSVPTVKEHLSALERAGLVERHEEGRKWKYYSLTKKGHGVLHPEEMKIWIVLGLFCFSVVGGILTYLRALSGSFGAQMVSKEMVAQDAVPRLAATVAEEAVQPVNWPVVFGVAALLFGIMLVYLFMRSCRQKILLGKCLTKK